MDKERKGKGQSHRLFGGLKGMVLFIPLFPTKIGGVFQSNSLTGGIFILYQPIGWDIVAFLGLGFHSATRLICMVGGNTWTQFKISPPPQIHWVGPLDAHTLEAFK
ncbi:hypothetical protein AAG906_025079 [Vitis piasezkii]